MAGETAEVSCLVVVLVRLPTTEALRCGDRGHAARAGTAGCGGVRASERLASAAEGIVDGAEESLTTGVSASL